MTTPDDSLVQRVTVVEREVARLREHGILSAFDAAAARVLAAGADRDVSEVRAEVRARTSVMDALRDTQLEQDRRATDGFATLSTGLTELGGEVTGLHGSVTGLRSGQAAARRELGELRAIQTDQGRQLTEGFAGVDAGMSRIGALLEMIRATDRS